MTGTHTINLGQDENDQPINLDLDSLMRSRALIQGASGSGKSYLARLIVEQAGHHVPVIVIDPEGEYATLRELHPMLLVGHGQAVDVPADVNTAAALAKRLNENNVSAVLDLSELPLHQRRGFVRRYIEGLMSVSAKKRQPAIVLVDEAHKFAAQSDKCESLEAMADLSSRGRKRKLCLIAATQRISKFHNDVAAELKNRLIGGTTLDVDVKRAGDELGMTTARRRVLTTLPTGSWYGFGPSFEARQVYEFVGGRVQTTHEDAALAVVPPSTPDIQAIAGELADLAQRHKDDVTTIEEAEAVIARLKKENQRLDRQLKVAGDAPPEVDEAEVRRRVDQAVSEAMVAAGERIRKVVDVKLGELPTLIESVKQKAGELALLELDAWRERFNKLEPGELHAAGLTNLAQAGAIQHDAVYSERKTLHGSQGKPQQNITTPAQPVEGVNRPKQKILDALAWFESVGIGSANRSIVAAIAGVSPRSSGFEKNLSGLRTLALIEYPSQGRVSLTGEGRRSANGPASPPSLRELHQRWLGSKALSRPQAVLLEILLKELSAMSREDLADRAGVSAGSSGFDKNVSRLSTLGLVRYPQPGMVELTELLFPEGLR
ncbi:MAG: ATP-binding protein [Phycisphaeraceae bacterium]